MLNVYNPRVNIPNMTEFALQKASHKNLPATIEEMSDDLRQWYTLYFAEEVTTAKSSQKEQERDLLLFLAFMMETAGNLNRLSWSSPFSKEFQEALKNAQKENGTRRWADSSIDRKIAHLKTFVKWIHRLRPFRLGEPTRKLKGLATGMRPLKKGKYLTQKEKGLMKDAADSSWWFGGGQKAYTHYA